MMISDLVLCGWIDLKLIQEHFKRSFPKSTVFLQYANYSNPTADLHTAAEGRLMHLCLYINILEFIYLTIVSKKGVHIRNPYQKLRNT